MKLADSLEHRIHDEYTLTQTVVTFFRILNKAANVFFLTTEIRRCWSNSRRSLKMQKKRYVCTIVRLYVCTFVRLYVCAFVRLCVRSHQCAVGFLYIPSSIIYFYHLIVRSSTNKVSFNWWDEMVSKQCVLEIGKLNFRSISQWFCAFGSSVVLESSARQKFYPTLAQ